MNLQPNLAFVGGTGKLGRGLALRLAAAGYPVLIGSRSLQRATEAVVKLRTCLIGAGRSGGRVEALLNEDAVARADLVFLTLPFETMDAFLDERGALLDGKIVVDVVNPLRLVNGRFELIPVPEGGAGLRAQRLVPRACVVSAFKNVAAAHLLAIDHAVVGDILIAGDVATAKDAVASLARTIPVLRPVDAGPLANGAFLEAITALELDLNRIHKAVTSIQILGVPDPARRSLRNGEQKTKL